MATQQAIRPSEATQQPTELGAIRRRGRKKSKAGPIVATAIVLGLVGWWIAAKIHASNSASSPMLTATVTRGNLVESVDATGSVTAQTGAEVKIGSQITGTIKRLYADVGSQVKAGQLIAELNLPDLEAQVQQANANLASARSKLTQTEEGVGMVNTQSTTGVAVAEAAVSSADAKLASAVAASRQQAVQTPTDIARAQSQLAGAQAALAGSEATYKQTKAGATLQVANAQSQINSATATEANSAANLKRQQALLTKGFVAASVVDQAQATATVNQALVEQAQQNLQLAQQKVTSDLQTYADAVTQAQESVAADQDALKAAQAEPYTNQAKAADVTDAQASVNQAEQQVKIAVANTANSSLKQQDVQQAEDAVQSATQQVAYNQAQMNKAYIRSPISGTVLQLAAQQGETLAAGLSAPTLIVVADLDRLQVDAFVDETDINKVQLGQPVHVTIDALPQHPYSGVVTKVASGSTIQQGIVTYDVTIAISDPKHQLKPDMTASCTIDTGSRNGVLLIPSIALHAGSRGTTVDVVKKVDGKQQIASERVKTGGTDSVNTEIVSGLNEGDVIVVAGGQATTSASGHTGGAKSPFGGSGGGGGRRGGM